ncbi:MAG: alcohol dehydrogenase catalytic domain-containing protein [Dehalococcoidia bacterium]
MKAAVLYEAGKPLVIEDVELDDPKENEIMIKLEAVGVCHTDLSFMKGEMPCPVPVVVGHEGCGIVEKVGPGVTSVQPGDKVITMVSFSCGKCKFCAQGMPTRCVENINIMMMAELPFFAGKRIHKGDQYIAQLFGLGSFAEYCVVHERSAVKVRDDAPSDVVCLMGCGITTGIGSAVNTGKVKVGDSVVVYGVGGVGLAAVMGAKLAGASNLIAVARSQNKLDMAKELGADHVVNPNEVEDPVAKVLELSGGTGCDVAIEASGVASVMMQAFGSIHSGGVCVIAGMAPMADTLTFMPFEFLLGKTVKGTVQGDIIGSVDVPKYVDMFMDGKLPIDKLITRTFSLDQVNEAFEAMENKQVLRSVVKL